jgi:inner membrane protein
VENAAHTLSGLVLARLGGDRHGPFATALLVTAANFPDVDCLSLLFGQEAYLRWHHGVTHSLVGAAIAGPLLGWLFFCLAHLRQGRDPREDDHGLGQRPGSGLGVFVALAYAGLAAHLFLDTLIDYGVRPWLPFDATWYYGDVVFVVDPWIWILFGVGTVLGGRRRGPGLLGWTLFAAATTGVAWYAPEAPRWAAPLLALLWASLLLARRSGWQEGRRRRLALLSVAAVVSYLGFFGVVGHLHHARGVAHLSATYGLTSESIERTSSRPNPCRPWAHRIVVQTADHLFRAEVGWSGPDHHDSPMPRRMDDPALRAIEDHPGFATWRQFARHPFTGRLADGALVLGDGRYSWAATEDWCNIVVR